VRGDGVGGQRKVSGMGIGSVHDLAGEWELLVGPPGAGGIRGHARFEVMGEVLVQRTTVPVPEAPDSCCVVVAGEDGGYVQHYFDSRGTARRYAMTFDGRTWTLERTQPDLSPLDFCQRFVGRVREDGAVIDGEWLTSADGRQWAHDFAMTYTRLS
jgi:hypothetical protein